ncbi:MAG: hypothetical protein PUC12_12265 [Clostridiales bacterium]|nr:hypothetical protein [Clostridiales bacterium]
MQTTDRLIMEIRDCCMRIQRQRAGVSNLEKRSPLERWRIIVTVVILALSILWSLLALQVMIVSFVLMIFVFIIPLSVAVIVQVVRISGNRKSLEQLKVDLALNEAHLKKMLEQLPEEEHFKVKGILEVTSNRQEKEWQNGDG